MTVKVSNPSGLKLLEIFFSYNFKISAPQCPTHNTDDGRGCVRDIVVHQNFQLLEATVTDILDWDHLSIVFSILGSVGAGEALDPVEILTDWELFQSLASLPISPNIQIHFFNEVDKGARDFEATTASAYRLSTRKTTILDRKYTIPALDRLLKRKYKEI
jgi:hypothetical protein